MPRIVPPELGAESFTCPHCGALAHQTWYSLCAVRCNRDQKPIVFTKEMFMKMNTKMKSPDDDNVDLMGYVERLAAKEIFLHGRNNIYNEPSVANVSVCRCYSCDRMSIWHADNLIYPNQQFKIEPNEDMPEDVRLDFLEAGAIVNLSARGSAALLRLAVQKLMPHLGEKGKNINDDIGALVKKGLDIRVQQALDSVRVIGNNAVHPGTMDLNDNKGVAIKLFDLVNYIVETQITAPKKIGEIYGGLPSTAVEAIAKRDSVGS